MDRDKKPALDRVNESDPAPQDDDAAQTSMSGEKVERLNTNSSENQVYSIHSRRKRLLLCSLASAAGFLSPFTANIYFPALNNIQHVSHHPRIVSWLSVLIHLGMYETH